MNNSAQLDTDDIHRGLAPRPSFTPNVEHPADRQRNNAQRPTPDYDFLGSVSEYKPGDLEKLYRIVEAELGTGIAKSLHLHTSNLTQILNIPAKHETHFNYQYVNFIYQTWRRYHEHQQ